MNMHDQNVDQAFRCEEIPLIFSNQRRIWYTHTSYEIMMHRIGDELKGRSLN
jgi:hypothetical protein